MVYVDAGERALVMLNPWLVESGSSFMVCKRPSCHRNDTAGAREPLLQEQ